MHRTAPRLMALFILILSFLVAAPADGRMSDDQLPPSTLGMRPNGGFLRLAPLADQEAKLGLPIRWHVALAGRQSPSSMRSAMFGQLKSDDAVLPGLAQQLDLVATVPLAFGKPGLQAENRKKLVETASGKWDRDFEAVAKSLVSGGYPDAVIRLGHEMTGHWYPWSAQGNPDEYIAAYRHVHDVFARVSRDFRFEWNTSRSKFITYGPDAYPGNDVVDIVGMDVYNRPLFRTDPIPDREWERQFERYMIAHRDFAIAHGKPVSYAEWANGNLDDPKFIQLMHDWMVSLPSSGPGRLIYQSYFNASNDEFNLDLYPESATAYYSLFGASTSPSGGGSGGGIGTPIVDAGAPQVAVARGDVLALSGSVVGNGPNSNADDIRVFWSRVAGKGKITWTGRAKPITTVTFNRAGTFVLRLEAREGEFTSFDDITVTVTDDGPPPPEPTPTSTPAPTPVPSSVAVSIKAATADEGNSGQVSKGFRIVLSDPATRDVTVTFATAPGTARPKADYRPRRDVEVVIPAGKTKAWVGVNIVGDRKPEPTEHFFVTIRDPKGASLGTSQARATILDDD